MFELKRTFCHPISFKWGSSCQKIKSQVSFLRQKSKSFKIHFLQTMFTSTSSPSRKTVPNLADKIVPSDVVMFKMFKKLCRDRPHLRDLKSEEKQKGHHETEKPHSLRQGEAQDGV